MPAGGGVVAVDLSTRIGIVYPPPAERAPFLRPFGLRAVLALPGGDHRHPDDQVRHRLGFRGWHGISRKKPLRSLRALTESGCPVDDERHGGVLDEVGQDGHRMEDLVEPEPPR